MLVQISSHRVTGSIEVTFRPPSGAESRHVIKNGVHLWIGSDQRIDCALLSPEDEGFSTVGVNLLGKHFEEVVRQVRSNLIEAEETYFDIEIENGMPFIQIYFEFPFPPDDDIIPFDIKYEGEEDEEEDLMYNIDENQFKPGYLNRNAVIVHYKQPFVDLFNETHDPSTTRYRLESTVYLIDTMFSPQQRLDWLKKNYDKIFTNELREQGISLVDWPKKRTFKVFSQYFDAEFKVTAFDLEKQPITKF